MSWIPLTLISAFFLSVYDVLKKQSVRDNSVMGVLFIATLCGTLSFALFLLLQGNLGTALHITWRELGLLVTKSLTITASWTFTYYALRVLPLSVVAPIRATAPFWTLIGAMALFGEIPTGIQAAGMVAILAGYAAFSMAGRAEGIRFTRNIGILWILLGTIFGAVSTLYDKYLLQGCAIARPTFQLWLSLINTAVFGGALLVRRSGGWGRVPFRWGWSIPMVGVMLTVADWFYFAALGQQGVPISTLSLLRRLSMVLSFMAGALFFGERNFRKKIPGVVLILVGMVLLCLFNT